MNNVFTETEKKHTKTVLEQRKTITYLSLFTLIYIVVKSLAQDYIPINEIYMNIVIVLLTASVIISLFIYRSRMNLILRTLNSNKTVKFNIFEVLMIVIHCFFFISYLYLVLYR